ncbi:required for drug-induced death protein 1 [Ictalurus furcatus]|uniref:required for drug-induced death protein 1 n=1 Tax=Ictalurus furcatus TaxID=66913 RepID=UPI0023506D81|nr:required for drug-induced death protein 1 [Ictalurus furcatus]
MSRKKLRKSKQKRKNKKEDKSKVIHCGEEECVGTKCEEFSSESRVCAREPQKQRSTGRKEKTSKQVHFTVLPDKYQPLEEDTASEEHHKEKQEKYKRFRKNFGKALRYTWKCLVVGLQNFSTSYSGPLSAASTLVPEIQRTRPRA